MLCRYITRSKVIQLIPWSTSFRFISWRSYRTKGALGKGKAGKDNGKGRPTSLDKLTTGGKKWLKSLEKPAIIAPGSEQHNDLPTFLAYGQRLELSQTSSVYVGTHYEYTVAASLSSLGFDLTRTGRASDHGIDLLGLWNVPSVPKPIRVLLQCKAYNKGLTPANVRELEGAFPGAPAGWRGAGVMGFLVATSQATKGMRDALIRSNVPMGFLQVTSEGKVMQFVWNHEAAQQGLEGMGVTIRFSPSTDDEHNAGNGLEQEIALTWKGLTLSKEQAEIEVAAKRLELRSRATKTMRDEGSNDYGASKRRKFLEIEVAARSPNSKSRPTQTQEQIQKPNSQAMKTMKVEILDQTKPLIKKKTLSKGTTNSNSPVKKTVKASVERTSTKSKQPAQVKRK